MRLILIAAAIAVVSLSPAYAQHGHEGEHGGYYGGYKGHDHHDYPGAGERYEHGHGFGERGHGFYGHREGHYWHGRYWNYGVGHCWEYDPRTGGYAWVCGD